MPLPNPRREVDVAFLRGSIFTSIISVIFGLITEIWRMGQPKVGGVEALSGGDLGAVAAGQVL